MTLISKLSVPLVRARVLHWFRIGVSTAKGLCYALNIPLLSIDYLKLVLEF